MGYVGISDFKEAFGSKLARNSVEFLLLFEAFGQAGFKGIFL